MPQNESTDNTVVPFSRALTTDRSGLGVPKTAATKTSGGDGGGGMDPRVDVLQNDVKHIFESIERIDGRFEKVDQRFDKIDDKFEKLDTKMDSHFKWLLGILVIGIMVPILLASLKYLGILAPSVPQ